MFGLHEEINYLFSRVFHSKDRQFALRLYILDLNFLVQALKSIHYNSSAGVYVSTLWTSKPSRGRSRWSLQRKSYRLFWLTLLGQLSAWIPRSFNPAPRGRRELIKFNVQNTALLRLKNQIIFNYIINMPNQAFPFQPEHQTHMLKCSTKPVNYFPRSLFHPQPPNSLIHNPLIPNPIIKTTRPTIPRTPRNRPLQHPFIRPRNRLTLRLRETRGARMRRIRGVEFVDDGVNHDGLIGDG